MSQTNPSNICFTVTTTTTTDVLNSKFISATVFFYLKTIPFNKPKQSVITAYHHIIKFNTKLKLQLPLFKLTKFKNKNEKICTPAGAKYK